jgi:rare lipoprotein A
MTPRLCAAICGAAILFAFSSSAMAKLEGNAGRSSTHRKDKHRGAMFDRSTAKRHQRDFVMDGCEAGQGQMYCSVTTTAMGISVIGSASMYNPFQPGYDEGGMVTASGEPYDPDAWTAAIQTDLREMFRGVRYGNDYRPAYALVEAAGRRVIIKINDVGPLKPGRVIDFNEKTMRFFDPSLQRGIVTGVRITPLPGDEWAPGPVNE